jgi:aminoglycoside phosphotransferase (APT) family kinase protein
VHRSTGPWTPTVHAFLRHLEQAGFPGSPRVLGMDDEGREILTFVDGDVLAAGATWKPGMPTPWPEWAQSMKCLEAAARLLRALHDASAGFTPPEGAVWRQYPSPALGAREIVCHGDIGPHNTVYREGAPVAFIDWDGARPNEPLVEFGDAAWRYVPLGDDTYFARSGFGTTPPLAHRLARFSAAYGVHDRDAVRWALHQSRQRSVEAARYWPITPGQGAAALRHVASELEWLDQAAEELVSEVG